MSWEDDTGTHEGYVRAEFADGVHDYGMTTGKVPADQVIVDVEYVGAPGAITEERYTTRPAAEVIGWRVVCDCRTREDSSTVTNRWTSSLIQRVPSKALQDIAGGKLYAVDEDVPYVDDTHYEELVALWRREHVDGLSGLAAISEATSRIAAAEHDLNAAAAAARAGGASWEAIGRAAGMTRQAAHGRWAPTAATLAAAKRKVDGAIAEMAAAPLDQPMADRMRQRLAQPDVAEARAVLRAAKAD